MLKELLGSIVAGEILLVLLVVLVLWPGELLLSLVTFGRHRPQFSAHFVESEGGVDWMLPLLGGLTFWTGVVGLIVWVL